jgi:hypothetical protein
MLIKKLIGIILFALIIVEAKAQEKLLNNLTEARDISQKVTQLFKENKISAAVKVLKPYWPLPSNELENFEEKTTKYLNMIEERFGKSEGIVKVNEEGIKDFALRETYLVKYQNTAIRLIFTYYKNNNGWIINGFKWDDSFTEEFR